ncbi:Regulator of chromosome condensation, RCC1 [Dillenia turbinata]|uniref:Regulator of chromosome condensation, RCC1 n=1 Tax=Dillenia turbinata TaxID=194707 RepID=A0AAN8Z212_9MAGN
MDTVNSMLCNCVRVQNCQLLAESIKRTIIGSIEWTCYSLDHYSNQMAFCSDGELYMWGKNSDGQLGLGKIPLLSGCIIWYRSLVNSLGLCLLFCCLMMARRGGGCWGNQMMDGVRDEEIQALRRQVEQLTLQLAQLEVPIFEKFFDYQDKLVATSVFRLKSLHSHIDRVGLHELALVYVDHELHTWHVLPSSGPLEDYDRKGAIPLVRTRLRIMAAAPSMCRKGAIPLVRTRLRIMAAAPSMCREHSSCIHLVQQSYAFRSIKFPNSFRGWLRLVVEKRLTGEISDSFGGLFTFPTQGNIAFADHCFPTMIKIMIEEFIDVDWKVHLMIECLLQEAAKVVPLPAKLECLNGITMAMAALGAHHSIAVTDDGETLSWGGGASGSLGHGRKPGIRDLFKSAR